MGMNSWTAFGSSVTEADLLSVANFFVSSGLHAKGYRFINSDDGWDTNARNDTTQQLVPDLKKFPDGIAGLTAKLGAMNISFGIYSAASSVVCSGRPGSLFYETLDAQTFADWGVKLVKYDSCGEYSYGNARFHAFADAVAATGKEMIISTEPFIINPNPNQARFAHYWRTGNDINANWETILNRIDINDKWWRFAGPGHFNDPDMLQIGNGKLTLAEQRSHFTLWAITKSTLILGSNVPKLSPAQLAIIGNVDLIAINQDSLGAQARKVAINGTLTPHFVGIAPCAMYEADATYSDGVPGPNGVTKAGMTFHLRVVGSKDDGMYALVSNETGRCAGLHTYAITPSSGAATAPGMIPGLVACDESDPKQKWKFPSGVGRIGSIQSVWALQQEEPSTALAVANSTLFGAMHGSDPMALVDKAYGEMRLGLVPFVQEAKCTSRNCQDYDPSQSWYVSPRSGTVRLAAVQGSGDFCYEEGCYRLTSHLPTYDEFCLARVASVSKLGVDPSSDKTGGVDVYAGPLAPEGSFVFGIFNRGEVFVKEEVKWEWLETQGFNSTTIACVKELYSGTVRAKQVGGSSGWTIGAHDIAVLRVQVGESMSC